MAYVFGMEGVPVFEMLFIIMILLLIGLVLTMSGLIFVLIELRKLTRLIRQEKNDISRFESDLLKFEGSSKRLSNDIVAHVKAALDSGLSRTQIESALYQRGWSPKQAERIFAKIGEQDDEVKILEA